MLWGSTALLLLAAAVHSDPQPLRCPSGVSSFSASHRPAHFYSCEDSTMAVLKECPSGQVYHGYTQRCRSNDDQDDPKPFDDKAMGRNVVLGSLYDGRKNVFHNTYLWNDDTIQEFKFKYDRKETTTSFSTDTRTEDRVDKFDISADLKMDFMNGQVSVSGAMRYLTDEVKSEKELNVELMYHTTKYTETFPKYIPLDFPYLCNDDYTHVVTSVTYGIDVNMVFKYLLADTESIENIYGTLGLTITAIPGLAIEGSGEVNLTSSQKEMFEHVEIKLYGDGAIPATISNYQDALDLYKELPSYAGTAANNYAGSTILDVHYTPITDICNAADYVLNAINDGLVNQITQMLTDIEQLGVKVKGLRARKATQDKYEPTFANQFPPIGANLDEFQKKWNLYQLQVKEELRHIIPNIRGGDGTGEDALAVLLQEHADSVFVFDRSNQFLMRRNREISAVFHLTQSFPTDKDDDNRNIVMYDYLMTDDVDLFLQKPFVIVLELRILTPLTLTENFLNGQEESEEGFWFNDFEINGYIGSLVRNLSRFAWENHESETQGYLVKLEEIKTDGIPGIQVQSWEDADVKDQFVIPTAPEQPIVHNISYNSIQLDVKYFSNVTTKARVYVTDAFDVTNEIVRDFPFDQPGESVKIKFDGLEAITLYTVTVKYVTVFGLSPPSPASLRFITAPSSPPRNLTVSYSTSQVTVDWLEPEHMGIVNETIIQKDDLSYSISINGMNGYSETKLFAKPTFTFTFDDLQDATKYNIEARTFFKEEITDQTLKPPTSTTTTEAPVTDDPTLTTTTLPTLSTVFPSHRGLHVPLSMTSVSLPSYIISYTDPTSPVMLPPFPGEVGLNSITVRWEGPFRMPEGASDISFVLAYATVDGDDNYGDFTEVSSDESNKVIDELTKNTKYAFKVRVVTNVGSSVFSSLLAIRTKDDETDLGKFEEDVMNTLDSLKEEAKKKSIVCAYQETFDPDKSNIITYSKVFVESSNIGATMNPSTGIFKAGASGSYMISTSMEMMLSAGQTHSIVVQRQGEEIAESRMTGKCNVNSFAGFYDNGSKNIVVELATGDEINLYASTTWTLENMDLKNIVFCVQSLKVN